MKLFCRFFTALLLLAGGAQVFGETVRLATYNVENYVESPTKTRRAKSAEAKAKVHDSILALKPDIIALEEIGTTAEQSADPRRHCVVVPPLPDNRLRRCWKPSPQLNC